MNSIKPSYRFDIDGLRAVAILAVIVNHSNSSFLPSGYLGVDIFFVISGYVISASLFERDDGPIRAFFIDFYVRRVRRLLPALLVCVMTTSFVITLFSPEPGDSLRTGLAALFGVSNIYLLKIASSYFGESAALNPFTHTWSLGVEEQFYAVYPIIFWFLAGRPPLFRKALEFIAIISVLAYFILISHRRDFAFYMMPTRFWEFTVGVLTFSISPLLRTFRYDRHVYETSFFCIFLTLCAPEQLQRFSTILIVILSSVVIGKAQVSTVTHKLLTAPTTRFFGRISYSLYLWHWVVLALSRWTIGITLATYPFIITLIIILGWASHRFVEQPFRFGARSNSSSGTLKAAAGSICLSVIGIWALVGPLQGMFFLGRNVSLQRNFTLPYTLSDGTRWNGPDCVLQGNDEVGKKILVESCTLGNPSVAPQRIVVIGNSFSAAMVHAFDALALEHNYAITVTSSWSASVVPEIKNVSVWDKANDYYWREIVPKLIESLRKGDWVLMINDMSEFTPERQSSESAIKLEALESGLTDLANNLHIKGVRLAILNAIPFARDAKCDPTQAIAQWYGTPGRCNFLSKDATLERRMPLTNILERVRSTSNVEIIDLMQIFCPGKVCDYERDGIVLYRDGNSHPSVEAARLSSSTILSVIKSAH